MKLHTISSSTSRISRRIGRGGKRGTTAGRGQKGQKSRSGHRIRPASRDIFLRIPKKRGFANKPKSEPAVTIELKNLVSALTVARHSGIVDVSALKRLGIVPNRTVAEIKVLGSGSVSSPFHLKGVSVSAAARKGIEAAGGRISS